MRHSLPALLVTLWLAGCGGGGEAVVEEPRDPTVALGSVEFEANFGVGADLVAVQLSLGQGSGPSPRPALFDRLGITERDVGSTFVVTSVDDPDFGPLAALLTNGVDDLFSAELIVPGLTSTFNDVESRMIEGALGPLAPDFQGATITRIELTIDVLSLTPGTNPFGGPEWTDVVASLRYVFFGVRN